MRKIGANAHIGPIIERPRASIGHLTQMLPDSRLKTQDTRLQTQDSRHKTLMILKPVSITLTFRIPATLERLLMSLTLAYHRLRYGYSIRLIPVGQGKYAIVDADDYDRLAKYKWQLCSKGHMFYACRYSSTRGGKKSRKVLMHREIIEIPEGLVCDHINRKSLNNRKANLRPATVAQNNCNRRKSGQTTSRYRGVSQDARSNKWIAKIRANGRRIHLGTFDDEVDAAKAYDAAARKYHGEFAVLNFPDRPRYRLSVLICRLFAKIGKRRRPSLQTSSESSPTSPRAQPRGLLKEISPLASLGRNDGMWTALRPFGRNDNTVRSIFSAKHRFSICRLLQKIGQNSVKARETCEDLIEIVRKYTILNTVQMSRGP